MRADTIREAGRTLSLEIGFVPSRLPYGASELILACDLDEVAAGIV